MRIVFRKGHSGGEVGAIAHNTTEFTEDSKVVNAVIDEFKLYKNAPDYLMFPDNLKLSVKDPNKDDALKWGNRNLKSGDILIDFHLNSGGANRTGAFMFYYGGDNIMKEKAKRFINTYCQSSGIPKEGEGFKPDTASRFGRLGIVRDIRTVNHNAFLLEMGYITNEKELETIRKKSARAIVLSIFSMLQIMPDIEEKIVEREFTQDEKDALKFVKDTGISDGSNPFGNAKRIEVFVLLYRFYKFIINKR